MHGGLAAGVLALLLTTGCSMGDADVQACTTIGGVTGVSVDVSPELDVRTGTVSFRVCDDACASATEELGASPAGQHDRRVVDVDFDDLGREFDVGTVRVRVDLRGPDGALVATREQDVDLVRTYPNGRSCDGDGFVHGGLSLEAGDAV